MTASHYKHPLSGIRVVELAGLAPSPFAGLLLADYGATVLRINRPNLSHSSAPSPDLLVRHKCSICLDLKSPESLSILKSLLQQVDVLIEPYRPGVLENLGLNPTTLLEKNKRLVVARLTGFRRDGKYSNMAGHDINYLAVSGVLSQLGRKEEPPYPPANILADFAGGGLMCAFGIIMALLARERTGKGQLVENNMVDGSAYLATFPRLLAKTAVWDKPRGENLLDGGCPFYDVYECKNGGYMAVGALEPQFFAALVRGLELEQDFPVQNRDRNVWPAMRDAFQNRFLQRTRKEWENVFDGQDACCTPVLGYRELEATGYEQRQAVTLTESPGLEVQQHNAWDGIPMTPGTGGEHVLQEWLGWRHEREFTSRDGALVMIDAAKL
ncbi:hypothetical protein MMC13_002251 [Lambiella insularis]|nr:hypothetical protein [Lambiella insularis]